MVVGKARQINQISYREMEDSCDLIVFGELDSTHSDWNAVPKGAGKHLSSSTPKRACNCFSIHGNELITQMIGEGTGWVAARCNNVLAVFVHVPNSLAKSRGKAIVFYQGIKNALLTVPGGGVIDVFIGDTNQSSPDFTPKVISEGVGSTFIDAHSGSAIELSDTWAPNGVIHKGTNSVDDKKFDVAVYNTETVNTLTVKYFSQLSHTSGKAAAYTDHMGMMIKVDKI